MPNHNCPADSPPPCLWLQVSSPWRLIQASLLPMPLIICNGLLCLPCPVSPVSLVIYASPALASPTGASTHATPAYGAVHAQQMRPPSRAQLGYLAPMMSNSLSSPVPSSAGPCLLAGLATPGVLPEGPLGQPLHKGCAECAASPCHCPTLEKAMIDVVCHGLVPLMCRTSGAPSET